MNEDMDAVGLQLPDYVHNLGIPEIRAAFLKGDPQDPYTGFFGVLARPDHDFDTFFGHEFAHAVIDPAAGQDNLRVISHGLGLVGQTYTGCCPNSSCGHHIFYV